MLGPWYSEGAKEMGQSYRDLIVWQKAMSLAKDIYRVTKLFPRDELYGLTSQLRRAAVSVPSNIAEGQARFSTKEFHHFLALARGSLVEIETQLMLVTDLGYATTNEATRLLGMTPEIGRLLNRLS